MRHILPLAVLLTIMLLAACGPAPTPPATVTPTATTQLTATASTTYTATPTPQPTYTPVPTQTPEPTGTPKPTKTPKPKAVYGCFTPGGMSGRTAPFKLEVLRTSKRAEVYINGVSRNGNDTIYCSEFVKQGVPKFLTLMWGDYTYRVQIGSKTMFGSFFINDDDKATMRIFADKIAIGPFP